MAEAPAPTEGRVRLAGGVFSLLACGNRGMEIEAVPTGGATMAKTAREVMSGGVECVGENETVLDAAKKLADLDVGSMPICGEDNRLKGMLTDRDIVVKVLAAGKDPADTRTGELGEGKPVTIGADDSVDEALRTMTEHKVRRLPVIDGHDLVGIVSQADLATNIDEEKVGDLVEAISAAP
jgi:CBS domain-containing protein